MKPTDWKDTEHPSWGKIKITRTSGQTHLFRSSLKHHNWITLYISRAKVVNTGLASDFMSDGPELIEVSMSETQFARMVTSIGMGAGSACTIERVNGERMPDCPAQDRKQFVIDAHSQHLDANKADLSEMLGRLQRMRVDKKRPTLKELDELIHKLACFTGNMDANHRFYRDQFSGEVEEILEDAKTEIEAHLLQSAGRLGIEASEVKAPRLQ